MDFNFFQRGVLALWFLWLSLRSKTGAKEYFAFFLILEHTPLVWGGLRPNLISVGTRGKNNASRGSLSYFSVPAGVRTRGRDWVAVLTLNSTGGAGRAGGGLLVCATGLAGHGTGTPWCWWLRMLSLNAPITESKQERS